MIRSTNWLFVLLGAFFACGEAPGDFEARDAGGGGDADGDGDTDGDTDTDVDTDNDADGDTDADTDGDTDADSDSDTSDTSTSSSTSTESSSDADTDSDTPTDGSCGQRWNVELDWDDAEVTFPMSVVPGADAGVSFSYIQTATANKGWAKVEFDVPCEDDWYLWGIAYAPDSWPNPPTRNFWIQVDDDEEFSWVFDGTDEWLWNRGRDEGVLWSAHLAPMVGSESHSLRARGGRVEWFTSARLGTVIITNDPGYEPAK